MIQPCPEEEGSPCDATVRLMLAPPGRRLQPTARAGPVPLAGNLLYPPGGLPGNVSDVSGTALPGEASGVPAAAPEWGQAAGSRKHRQHTAGLRRDAAAAMRPEHIAPENLPAMSRTSACSSSFN